MVLISKIFYFRSKNMTANYKFIKKLGQGTFGVTYLVEDRKSHLQYALKIIDIKKSEANGVNFNDIIAEIKTLITLSSDPKCYPYIACYYNYSRAKFLGRDSILILSEYINGPTLSQLLEQQQSLAPLAPKILINYMYQLISGLTYIHEKGYAHRDIKPDNIILNSATRTLKYIDFGLACHANCRSIAGTVYWMPPELFHPNFTPTLLSSQAHDVWSLGVVFYQLANQNNLPFTIPTNASLDQIKRSIQRPLIPSDYHVKSTLSPKINYIIDSMLRYSWRNRPKARNIKSYISQYITNYP